MARQLHTQRPGLDDFVADLTDAAYPVALRHKGGEDWLDLQLNLWRVLTATVHKWEQRIAQAVNPPEPVLIDVPGRKAVGSHADRLSPCHA
jgi:hypothetical protein